LSVLWVAYATHSTPKPVLTNYVYSSSLTFGTGV
jgi:hypothetical protein